VNLKLAIPWALTGAGLVAASAAAETPPRPDALKVLEHLQAAHQARLEAGRVAEEAERSALERRAQAARVRMDTIVAEEAAQRARRELAELEAKQAPLDREEAALRALMLDVAERIHATCDALAAVAPPGVVPARPAVRSQDPELVLGEALDRLESAEQRAGQTEVVVADGTWTDGTPRTVEVLRLGAAAAWWLSMDGTTAGVARMDGGQLKLEPRAEILVPIQTAVAIAKGRAAPDLVQLPVEAP
jgi:hypothetical protein